MQFPREEASYVKYLHFAAFVIRALQIAKRQGTAEELSACLSALKEASRAWEDAEAVAYASTADESAAIVESQQLVAGIARQLGARDATAKRKPPYTQLFPKGLTPPAKAEYVEYLRALSTRINEFLPEADPLRAHAPTLVELAATIENSRAVVGRENQATEVARIRYVERRATLLTTLKKTYHALAQELDAKTAASFFPTINVRVKLPPTV